MRTNITEGAWVLHRGKQGTFGVDALQPNCADEKSIVAYMIFKEDDARLMAAAKQLASAVVLLLEDPGGAGTRASALHALAAAGIEVPE